MADTEALAQGAVEALLQDESLRGDLTDEGFEPLLGWATDALTAVAEGLAATAEGDAAAYARMAIAGRAVRGVVAAAVRAAQDGDLEPLLAEPLLARDPEDRARVASAGLHLGADPDANATLLARALAGLRP